MLFRQPLIKKAVSQATSIPAPIGGWNARDALGDMDPTDAVKLINYFPRTSDVMFRKGYSQYATGLPGQVESLLAYASPTATKMFAVSVTAIYNVSTSGPVGAAAVGSLSNARFQYVNVSTSGGNFMLCVNGADKLQGYDGTNWYADGDASHDITGFDTSLAININLFKTRVWLIEKESLKVWYLGVNSISGAANSLDFSAIARRGGHLIAMGTWTLDAGYGADDLAVFVTSQGEVIVYRGTDPTSTTTWALVGVWQLGSPIGNRCFLKWAGDLLLLTQDGLLPLAGAVQSSRVDPRIALTDKIQSAVSNSATLYGSNFGWQICYYAKANMLILNVPIQTGITQEQYVMNTITKAWGQFQNVGANCWEIFNDEPYFGGNGFVGKMWDGFSDNQSNIVGDAKQAFNYFKSRGQLKRFTMIRPIVLTNAAPAITAILNVEFEDVGVAYTISYNPTPSLWDQALWGDALSVQKSWQGVTGVGYCAAPRIQISAQGTEVYWVNTDIVYERGGIL